MELKDGRSKRRRDLEQGLGGRIERGVSLSIVYYTHPLLRRYNLSYTLNLHFVIKTLPPLPSDTVTDSPHST